MVGNIDEKLDRYIVTKRGRPMVVMLSIDDYQSLIEIMDILADKETMKDIKIGLNEIKAGKVISLSDFMKKYEEI